jgi:hypothetical protein
MTARIFYHGRDNIDYIITMSINGTIWDYHMHNLQAVESCAHLAKRVSVGKAFAYAKKHCLRACRRNELATSEQSHD